jgi:hypothetical protein
MITAIVDLKSSVLSVQADDDRSLLSIGFTNDKDVVDFDNLAFGWTLYRNGVEETFMSYPPEDVTYLQTDQPVLVTEQLPVFFNTPMSLYVWSKNAGTEVSQTIQWIQPDIDETDE